MRFLELFDIPLNSSFFKMSPLSFNHCLNTGPEAAAGPDEKVLRHVPPLLLHRDL